MRTHRLTGVATALLAAFAAAPADAQGGCTLTCPANLTVPNDAGFCGAVLTYPAPTPTGTCGTVTCTPPSGSFFPVGTTTISCAASVGTTTTTVYSSGNVAVPIPQTGTVGDMVPQVIAIADPGNVTDVNFRFRANHTFDGDLSIRLVGPDGTTISSLVENRGGSGDNFGSGATDCSGTKTVLDDEAATAIGSGSAPFAGSFRPETPLSVFDGAPAAGNWTFRITDEVGGDSGTLFCWELEVTRVVGVTCDFTRTVNDVQPPAITCSGDIALALPPGALGSAVSWPDPPVSDNCPGVAVPGCAPPSGSTFPVGTTGVVCSTTDAAGNSAACGFDVILTNLAIQAIPTLSTLGLALLSALVAAAALVALKLKR